jgi:hypothetical protein
MALTPESMIPGFMEAFSAPIPDPSITAIKVVETVSQYLSTGMNAAFGGFVCWGYPYAQIEATFRVPVPEPSIFATNFTGAIISGLAGLYTTFQVVATPAGPIMYPILLNAVLTVKPNSMPFCIELASAIHAQATATIITVSDPKVLGSVYPGPFF